MSGLHAEQFSEYFNALHGRPPFPWQESLARHVCNTGTWPSTLDLPTGAGKTAALDVAVFHLALQASAERRQAPVRIVYVVDRRTIVDQAYVQACHIARSLEEASSGILSMVRDALTSLSRDGEPVLAVELLRGGIARSDGWARSPNQPLIAVSTVDQVGSRLLFRGYGVSPSMRPVHAGLLGNDVLYLLDEVHLSAPFCQTLQAVQSRYASWGEKVPSNPFHVVQMSATPGTAELDRFELGPDDRSHPLLRQRLESSKPARLREVNASKLVGECVKEASEFAASPGRAVLVVVNRVQTAREVATGLRRDAKFAGDVHLVTGRMRPVDRESAERGLVDRMRAGRTRDPHARPLIVVATQCIEAGADFDFDALVTECASLDALRQRFGRLDRLGELGSAPACIVASTDTLKDDPVYRSALGQTWAWLRRLEHVDFGITRLPDPEPSLLPALLAPRESAPILLPSHLDAWAQTSPSPLVEPEVALFLHGPERGVADCLVVWRADLTEALLRDVAGSANATAVMAMVESVPPTSGEAMPVPFRAAVRWLTGRSEARVSDVEGGLDEGEGDETARPRPYVIWRGDDSRIVQAGGTAPLLRPGDTIVVPSEYGGIEDGTWSPAASGAVRDVGDIAAFRQRGRAVMRLQADVLRSVTGIASVAPPRLPGDDDEDTTDVAVVGGWLASLGGCEEWPADARELVRALRSEGRRIRVERTGPIAYAVVMARRRFRFGNDEVSTEDDVASFTGAEVTLRDHLAHVVELAAVSCRHAGLPETITSDITLAALCHDVGKADRRFQRLLHGGSAFRAEVAREPLAKSARLTRSRQERMQAGRRSGYPLGARHELQSLAMMMSNREWAGKAGDTDLVLHLVASHHGHCRPFAPWVPDPDPVDVGFVLDGTSLAARSDHGLERLDSAVGERFWLLVRRYGWWGLAWMEAVMRLADHRASEAEQKGDMHRG